MGRFDLRFDTVETSREIQQTQDFLLRHPGEYDPATYIPWVIDTCIPDIKSGARRSFAWWQKGDLVADAIIKAERTDVAVLRHFRVEASDFAHRGLGSFALRQVFPVAIELLDEQGLISSDATSIAVQLDTKYGSSAAQFFVHHGFEVIDQGDLYGSGTDVIMRRSYPLDMAG